MRLSIFPKSRLVNGFKPKLCKLQSPWPFHNITCFLKVLTRFVVTWLCNCSELHWTGPRVRLTQTCSWGWPSSSVWVSDSHIYMLAPKRTKPRSSFWQEAVASSTWNQDSISRDQLEPSAQRPSHSSSVCPWRPAQKLSVPWIPGEITGFWGVFLVTGPSRWKVCWMQVNRPSLSNPARRWAALSHIPSGPRNSWVFFPSAWYLPSDDGGLPAPLRSWRKAEIPLRAPLSLDTAQSLQTFPLRLCFPLPLLSLQCLGTTEAHEGMYALVLKMSQRNVRESARGEGHLYPCEDLLRASHLTHVTAFSITVITCPIVKMHRLTLTLSTAVYFLLLIKGVLGNLWPWAREGVTGAQCKGEVAHSQPGGSLALVTSAHCLRLWYLALCAPVGIRNSPCAPNPAVWYWEKEVVCVLQKRALNSEFEYIYLSPSSVT